MASFASSSNTTTATTAPLLSSQQHPQPPPPRPKWFRARDGLALLASVVLTRVAWQESASVSAELSLLYYYPTHASLPAAADSASAAGASSSSTSHLVGPVLLDVDGDGSPEAWVVIRGTNQHPDADIPHDSSTDHDSYKIQVLDLKKQQQSRRGGGSAGGNNYYYYGPTVPPLLVESSTHSLANFSAPTALATGHLPLVAAAAGTAAAAGVSGPAATTGGVEGSDPKIDERSRRYFCGRDWHDATTRCGTPCPKGDSTVCPDDERCFADTSCDYYQHLHKSLVERHHMDLSGVTVVTPAGGIPVIVTAWERGYVTCDGLIANNETNKLELRNLWTVRPATAVLGNATTSGSSNLLDWLTSKVDFVDAVTSGTSHGMVLVTTSMILRDEDDDLSRIVFALDAKTGNVLWETLSEQWFDRDDEPALLLPLTAGIVRSSAARRRTLARSASSSSSRRLAKSSVPNCLHAFKRSLLTSGALPHLHWTEDDVKSQVLHFDPQVRLQQQQHQHGATFPRRNSKDKAKSRSPPRHPKQHFTPQPKYGRPNVVVTFVDSGIHVRSLKNGHELCRLSLWDRTLYADLNRDGTLDAIHVITRQHRVQDDDDNEVDPHRDWIRQLADRVSGEKKQRQVERSNKKRSQPQDQGEVDSSFVALCHLQALSGLPSQEELFSTNVCGTERRQRGRQHYQPQQPNHPDILEAAPPLLVEGRGRSRFGSYDVITAVSSGAVTRVDGLTGRKQWQLLMDSDVPRWEQDHAVLLARIDSGGSSMPPPSRTTTMALPPRARPILLVGEDGMVILSPSGKKLASTKFPQPSIQRPVLMDVNGDGVADVIVTTTDAVWAYVVVLRASSTSMFRMAVGFLLLGILLALLRNRFQRRPGMRTTDAPL